MNKSNGTERHLSNAFKVNYIVLLLFILSGCSKDDNPDKELSQAIKEVVGTYKGELNSKELPKGKYANAIVFAEKVDDQNIKIRVKSGESYSVIPDRVIKVVLRFDGDVVDHAEAHGGRVLFVRKQRQLAIASEIISATDILFDFQGDKQ